MQAVAVVALSLSWFLCPQAAQVRPNFERSRAVSGSCAPSWQPTFGGHPGLFGGFDITGTGALALTTFDDGSGPALFVAGEFASAGGVQANRIAKWDGGAWTALASGMDDGVHCLTVFDDGSGAALYAGGDFLTAGGVAVDHLARWDGAVWSAVGGGLDGYVRSVAVFDDGSGPALFVGGHFSTAGGVGAYNMAKWDGTSWSALGSGLETVSRAFALAVFDDGSGPALYAGGDFLTAGGASANHIAKWDGANWSSLGSGVDKEVRSLAVFDAGTGGGPALYAAGPFGTAGGIGANRIAKWDGSSWSPLGIGLSGVSGYALAVFDDGSGGGTALYVGGRFGLAGGATVNNVARWDGTGWAALGGGVTTNSEIKSFAIFDDGSGAGARLYAGGTFPQADGLQANDIASWDGSRWSPLGRGFSNPLLGLAVFDDGSGGGPALHAGGGFLSAGGSPEVKFISKWNGASWSAVGSGTDAVVTCLTTFDEGGGPALYAGGGFALAGGAPASRIARWDGTSWSGLGSGMDGSVSAMTSFDDGGGPALYAGGGFTSAGGVAANRVAKWDGTSWSPLGSGMSSPATPSVAALTVFDDGGGPALYAGGSFESAGGVSALNIARWDGASWSPLGSGVNTVVQALAVFDDGDGPALYVGGFFSSAGGVPVANIARWDGASWSGLGSGVNSSVAALTVFDDGCGPALYASGAFTSAGGTAAKQLARWDGTSWSALGNGFFGTGSTAVLALATFEHESTGGPALYAAGRFWGSIDSGDSWIARWQGCLDTFPPALHCPPSLMVRDRPGNGPGESVTFSVTADDVLDPSPSVVCTPPSGSFFPPGSTLVTCTATDAAQNQSSCSFQVIVRTKIR